MDPITYEKACMMKNLTFEEIKEQAYLAQRDCRTDDMVGYCRYLSQKRIPVSLNLDYSFQLAENFMYHFSPDNMYWLISNYVLKGDCAYDQIMGLFLLIFCRLKDNWFNFEGRYKTGIPYRVPYLSIFSKEMLDRLEHVLELYEEDRSLHAQLSDKIGDTVKYKKVETTFFKLRLLLCDMQEKVVDAYYEFQAERGTGEYDMDISHDFLGTPQVSLKERKKEAREREAILPYYGYSAAGRERYAEKIRAAEPDYPVDINTWEGYSTDFEALNRFFCQFGIYISSPREYQALLGEDVSDENKKKEQVIRNLEKFYQIQGSRGNKKDKMKSLITISDEENMRLEEIGSHDGIGMIGGLVLCLIGLFAAAAILDVIVPRSAAKEVTKLLEFTFIVVVVIVEIVLYWKGKRQVKKEREERADLYNRKRRAQIDYIDMLYAGKLPLL